MALPAMLACLLFQQTWVVDDDGGPGVNFTDIPPAIAAAADGDLLLVQAGTYSHFALSGKGLRILGDGATSAVVSLPGSTPWRTTIAAIPPTSVAYIEGLRFEGTADAGPRVSIAGASTRAVLADVVVIGPQLGIGFCSCIGGPCPALRVDGSEVHVFRSVLQAAGGGCSALCGVAYGGRALLSMGGARVHLASSSVSGGGGGGCLFAGGLSLTPPGLGAEVVGTVSAPGRFWIADSTTVGGTAPCTPVIASAGPSGAPGLVATSSTVRISGDGASLVKGGDGGGSVNGLPPPAGPGIGIIASGSASVTVHSIPVLPGTSTCPFSVPASATSGPGIVLNATPLPVLRVSGNLTTAGSADLSLTNGPPSTSFFVAVSLTPGNAEAGPLFLGEILIDPVNWVPLFGGTLSPAGDFSATVPLAGLPQAFFHLPLYLQAIALDPAGSFWRVSNSTVATIRP